MQDFLQSLYKRTSIFAIVIGAILALIGAASEFSISTASLKIPDIGGRVILIVLGVILIGFGLYFELREHSSSQKNKPSTESEVVDKSLQIIDFKYQDSPTNHDWKIFWAWFILA
jgi:putative Mn2+ efflux pump MntP